MIRKEYGVLKKMGKKESFAKLIRITSAPWVWATMLLLIIYVFKQGVFSGIYELLLSILFLVIIPFAVYPLQPIIPKYKDKGREGQRNLAFISCFLGYFLAVLYGILARTTTELLFIYVVYFLSWLALWFSNKIIKFRSSGHMCGITGPMVHLIYFIGWQFIIPCGVLFGLICWSSLLMKHHTAKEVIGGCCSFCIAFISGMVLVH